MTHGGNAPARPVRAAIRQALFASGPIARTKGLAPTMTSRPRISGSAARKLTILGLATYLSFLPALQLDAAEVTLNVPDNKKLSKQLSKVSLTVAAAKDDETDTQDLLAAAKADYRRLVGALYDDGYFGPYVSIMVDGQQASNISELTYNKPIQEIRIEVIPGPIFTFSEAVVDPMPQNAEPVTGFAVGQTATTGVMSKASSNAVKEWQNRGNAMAEITSQVILADHENDTIAARFAVQPGPQLTFGKTYLSQSAQDSAVKTDRILEIAGIPNGEVYSPQAISDAERRLRNTGAFSSAVVEQSQEVGPNDTLDVTINTTDALPHGIGFGAEYSTNEGLSLSGYWTHRNVFGNAERLKIQGDIEGIGGSTGGVDYSLDTTLVYPSFLHPDMDLAFGFLMKREDEPTYLSDIVGATVGLDYYINPKVTGMADVGLRYSKSRTELVDDEYYHATVSGGIRWDNRDNNTDPVKGAYAEGEVMPFVGLNGSASGVRSTADIRAYYPVLGQTNRLVMAGRVQLGSVVGPSIPETPPDWLFYSGGGGTVRGQGYESLGVSVDGVTTGGRSFSALSFELRSHFSDNWGAVGFVDYGYVAAAENFSGGAWQGGAGLGVRYFTSLGPIRMDLAVPVTGEASTRPLSAISVYIGLGQAF